MTRQRRTLRRGVGSSPAARWTTGGDGGYEAKLTGAVDAGRLGSLPRWFGSRAVAGMGYRGVAFLAERPGASERASSGTHVFGFSGPIVAVLLQNCGVTGLGGWEGGGMGGW